MKIIISPAKRMVRREDVLEVKSQPYFLEQAEELRSCLKVLTYESLKTLWKCNDKIAGLNAARLETFDLHSHQTPALLSYEGIQYQHMAPLVFQKKEWEYVNQHLIILSGLYGLLRPFDGVIPYRLEMQAKFPEMEGKKPWNLYQYWKDRIYKEVTKEDKVILNLASKEYSKVIEPYLSQEITYTTCIFGTRKKNKKGTWDILIKGTEAKMARGEMVRYLAENQIENMHDIKEFQKLDYQYCEELSQPNQLVFLKAEREKEISA